MRCGYYQDEVIFHEGLNMDVPPLLRAFDQGYLDIACNEGLQHLVGVSASDGHSNPWVMM
jgi:hypothetical protein